jgi:hypothetical protein
LAPGGGGADAFAPTSPNLARWVTAQGLIELGDDGLRHSFIRVLDEGGLIWEGEAAEDVDDVLRAADAAVGIWIREGVGR